MVQPPRLERGPPRSTIWPFAFKTQAFSANRQTGSGLVANGLAVILQTESAVYIAPAYTEAPTPPLLASSIRLRLR